MKYNTQGENASVVSILMTKPATGNIRVAIHKLVTGLTNSTLDLSADGTSSATTNLAVASTLNTRLFTYDIRAGLDTDAADSGTKGTFDTNFPQWASNAVVVGMYDDGDAENTGFAKLCFGGGEDELDGLRGDEHLTLADLKTEITGGEIWKVQTGIRYDKNETDSQTDDVIEFTPSLSKNNQVIDDVKFLKSASVSLTATDSTTELLTGPLTDNATEDATATSGLAIGATSITLNNTTIATNSAVIVGNFDGKIVSEELNITAGLGTTTLTIDALTNDYDNGANVYVSASDSLGVFNMSKTDTSSLTADALYTLKLQVTYKGQTYTTLNEVALNA